MIRRLQVEDFYGYITLLGQLTNVGSVSEDQFKKFVNSQTDDHFVLVFDIDEMPVGCLTILIEQKISHSFSSVMHIEDVVVDTNFRKMGIANSLINDAISYSKDRNCYKIILIVLIRILNSIKNLNLNKKNSK